MKCNYRDILMRIPARPIWWDEYGVPRYEPFTPDTTANIYAKTAVLFLIECQACQREFNVCLSESQISVYQRNGRTFADDIAERTLHYGDPPNLGCCAAGPSMNSVPRRTLEFWHRPSLKWERNPDLEGVDLTPDWAK